MYYASDFRRIAREALQNNWGLAIITGLVAGLLGVESSFNMPNFQWRQEYSELFSSDYGRMFLSFFAGFFGIVLIYGLVAFIIGSAVQLGYIRFNRNLLDRSNAQFMDIFSRFQIFGKAFLLRVLMAIFTFLWTLLFIIPGIIAAYSYAMAPYILEENPNMTASDAIAYSKDMMRGNKWRLFCLHISFIGWVFVCIFTCGIGFLWLNPYAYMAELAFFYDVSGKFSGQNAQFQQNGQFNQYQQDQQYNQYQQNGYQQNGYQQYGTQQNGYQQNGYQQSGTQQNGYQQNGYQQSGTQQNGYQQNGYQQSGTQQNGYQQSPSQQNGYQQNGNQASGYQQGQNQYDQHQQDGFQQNTGSSNEAQEPGQSNAGNQSEPIDPNNTTNS
jgi:uncharacterized membrane protein